MVGDNAQGNIGLVALAVVLAGDLGNLVGDVAHGVNVEQGANALNHARQTLQTHAGVDVLLLQLRVVAVYAGWKASTVPDMLNGDDHYAYVVGYSDGTVRPNANISRAEVATIFFRLLKKEVRDGNLTTENTFADVTDGQWHTKAISTMAKLVIVKGRRADSFDPDASITRAEFAAICARFNTKPVENSGSFSDISGHWAENEIERAAAFGWISGYPDGTFRPDARITRAEAMTMINRVLCRMPQSESNLLDSMVTWPDNKPSDWHYLAVQEATNSHDFNRQGEVGESWTKLTSVPDWKRYQ